MSSSSTFNSSHSTPSTSSPPATSFNSTHRSSAVTSIILTNRAVFSFVNPKTPHKAISPGLIYDISTQDYIAFLCSLGYTMDHVQLIVKHPNVTCSRKLANAGQLNYPSFSVVFGRSRIVRYVREVTNVGLAGSTYQVAVNAPSTVGVSVKPNRLVFRNAGDKLRYTVTFMSNKGVSQLGRSAFGSITWTNSQHEVRSPVAFSWTHV